MGKSATVGSTIGEARRAKGISQKELAAQIKREGSVGLSLTYLNDIENGRRVGTPEVLAELERILGIEPGYLGALCGRLPSWVTGLDQKLWAKATAAMRRILVPSASRSRRKG